MECLFPINDNDISSRCSRCLFFLPLFLSFNHSGVLKALNFLYAFLKTGNKKIIWSAYFPCGWTWDQVWPPESGLVVPECLAM
jgi:hypothetical protein